MKHLKSSLINPNISKYKEYGNAKELVMDRRSDMTSKYGTNLFIIIRHYKWEDWEIDADR